MGGPKRVRDANAQTALQDDQPTKKRRVFSEQDKRLAKAYEELADEVGDVRINAAKELLAELPPQASGDDAADVKKVALRLIKGLCSSRKAARLGYFVALTELLRQIFLAATPPSNPPSLDLETVVQLAVKTTEPDSGASGQEKRDHLLGRVAACNAILLSRILEQPVLATVQLSEVLDLLSSLARAKTWLREECGNVIYKYAQGLDKASANPSGTLIFEALAKHGLLKTPEGIAIWVALQPKVDNDALPKHVWKSDDPLHTGNWRSVAVVMRTGSLDATDDSQADPTRQKGGASQPEPSFAWMAIISAFVASHPLVKAPDERQRTDKAVEDFWRDLVDNNLFSQSASQEKKGWGFTVLASALSALPVWALSSLFSPNLMKTLLNHRSDVNRYLHAAALVPLNAVKKRASRDPAAAAELLRVCLGLPDITSFDQATKSKTLDAIATAPHAVDALSDIASALCTSLSGLRLRDPGQREPRHLKARASAVLDLFVLFVRHHTDYVDNRGNVRDWVEMVFFTLSDYAFHPLYTSAGSSNPALTDISRLARTRLQACLSAILGADSDAGSICAETVTGNIFVNLVVDTSGTRIDLDKAVRKRLTSSYRKLDKNKSSSGTIRAIKLLHSLTLLEAISGEVDALTMLDDIDPLYLSISNKSTTDGDQSVILTEIILSFIAKPSTLFRRLAETVFTSIASQLSPSALQALIDVLQKPETLSGQRELFDPEAEVEAEVEAEEEDDDDSNSDGDSDVDSTADGQSGESRDESSEDDMEVSMDSDVEVIDNNDVVNGAQVNGKSEDPDSGSVEESEDDENEQELLKLDAVLAETLGTSNRLDGADDDDSDADMDDDQMMALEPALTKIFQERRKAETSNKKQDRKDAKENMVNFKNRVLDLLQIYLKQAHASLNALDLILPLLSLIRTTSTKQLSEKAFNVLKVYFDSSKGKALPVVDDPQPLLDVLTDVHLAAERNEAKMYSTACSRSSLFLARVLLTADPDLFGHIEDLYSTTMKRRRHKGKKSKIQRNFFLDWTNYAYDLAR